MFLKTGPDHGMTAQKRSNAFLKFAFGDGGVVQIVLNDSTRIVGDRREKCQRVQQLLLKHARSLAKPIANFHNLTSRFG